ncbi:IS30 family transposase [Chitinilyticum aquatile]|uniref:IS30 family transposase n=1 Tax=Chitinilyticum aquatile TaxID=362520 RepID=UPI00042640B3|nr:IS30 family transposase [Chitinilyticum aquatile]
MRGYRQISISERHQIAALLSVGVTDYADIAAKLGRAVSTIKSELQRNTLPGQPYDAATAQQLASERKANNAKRLDETVWAKVETLMAEDWSPEQIAGSKACRVSHMSIYRWVAADKRKGGKRYRMLRHGRPYRQRHTKETRGKIPNRRDITERPQIVETRERVGDWELDLVIGAQHQGALISLNERKTGLALQKWVPGKHADAVADGVLALLLPLQSHVKTITSDNGMEFAEHERVAQRLGVDFYFAKPHAPWQRGSNENTNGLIRQYFPKGESMKTVEEWRIYNMRKQLNTRPRKRLGYKTPLQVFAELTGMEYDQAAKLIRIT